VTPDDPGYQGLMAGVFYLIVHKKAKAAQAAFEPKARFRWVCD
jgi:hypothetical protein